MAHCLTQSIIHSLDSTLSINLNKSCLTFENAGGHCTVRMTAVTAALYLNVTLDHIKLRNSLDSKKNWVMFHVFVTSQCFENSLGLGLSVFHF